MRANRRVRVFKGGTLEVNVIKRESVVVDGVDLDVETVQIGKGTARFTIGQLSVGQIENIIKRGASGGFGPSLQTIAESMGEAIPAAERRPIADTLADLARLRLPVQTALHGEVLRLSGMRVAQQGEEAAAPASTSNSSAAA